MFHNQYGTKWHICEKSNELVIQCFTSAQAAILVKIITTMSEWQITGSFPKSVTQCEGSLVGYHWMLLMLTFGSMSGDTTPTNNHLLLSYTVEQTISLVSLWMNDWNSYHLLVFVIFVNPYFYTYCCFISTVQGKYATSFWTKEFNARLSDLCLSNKWANVNNDNISM